MPEPQANPIAIAVSDNTRVSGLLLVPPRATACFVFAHGAGAGMTHPFMAAVAAGWPSAASRHCATSSPTWSRAASGRTRRRSRTRRCAPPSPRRAGVARPAADRRRQVVRRPHDVAGAGAGAAAGVRGLAFLGFPLHPASRPSDERAEHLVRRPVPMLFLQGTRDALAELSELEPVVEGARRARDAEAVRGCRSFVPCAGAQRAQGRRRSRRDAGCVRRVGGARQNQPRRLNQISGMIVLSAIMASPNG